MKSYKSNMAIMFFFAALISIQSNCKEKVTPPKDITPVLENNNAAFWVTKADKSILLKKQANLFAFGTPQNVIQKIEVDTTQTFQTIDGFGFTLTGGSASLINALPETEKNNLLKELFGNDANSISISYLRVSLGASDLSASVFSYNDLPTGQTDVNLTNFNLSKDTIDVIPILQKILAINPNIKILASPWSPPVWMKDNASSIGGSLQTQYYTAYANYFVKYIKGMKANGISIDAVTIQNEPQHGGNNPSMVMSALQQANFVKNNLGPAFQSAGLNTKIIIWDHNCDNPNYPITILNDASAKSFVNGSAFHLYAGDVSAMGAVHNAHPDKDLYFTEQWTSSTGDFGGDFKWHMKNVIIGSMNYWSKIALEWNLANDGGFNPHTPGGCTQCKGALTFDGAINRNVAYYIIAQASKFVPPASVRISSVTTNSQLYNVAFKTPEGKKVLIVLNESASLQPFKIIAGTKTITTIMPAESAATFIW